MADSCAAAAADMQLVEGLFTSIDCHINGLVDSGYGVIAGPHSPLMPALTAALTLYIAIVGLRLMLGLGGLRVGEVTMAFVKIGTVLALASNWPLYHQLIFETLFRGPEQFAGEILRGAGSDNPVQHLHGVLQLAFDEMQASAEVFAKRAPGGASPWLGGTGFAAAALNLSSVWMIVATLGVLLGLKIALAVVLLAGPLFLGFFLFPSTRGLFTGWARAAIALSLAPLFAMLAMVLQLELIQPHLATLAANRAQGAADPAPAYAILVVTLILSLATLAGLIASGVVGFSLRLPVGVRAKARNAPEPANPRGEGPPPVKAAPVVETAPRVASVAAAAAALERRDSRLLSIEGGARAGQAPRGYAERALKDPAFRSGLARRRAARPSETASTLRRDG